MDPAEARFFRADQLSKCFGGIVAVEGLSLALKRGELLGLIGPNGSGKTTTIDMIAGAMRPDRGAIHVDGIDMTGRPAHLFARRGVARTFQVPRLFKRMSVVENLLVPGLAARAARFPDAHKRAREVLRFLKLEHLASAQARTLSGGQQKLLELGRALMARPHFLLLDEPFAGVHPTLLDQLSEHIRALNGTGQTILIVDHNLDAIRSLVRRAVVMAQGRMIADGAVDEVFRDPNVIRAYTGTRRAT
jgi:ABC-type branched-subunit amino acid transport system ATPase component